VGAKEVCGGGARKEGKGKIRTKGGKTRNSRGFKKESDGTGGNGGARTGRKQGPPTGIWKKERLLAGVGMGLRRKNWSRSHHGDFTGIESQKKGKKRKRKEAGGGTDLFAQQGNSPPIPFYMN